MSSAISVNLKRTTSVSTANGQWGHDLRRGTLPNYVRTERSRFNRILIQPMRGAALRQRAIERRERSNPKRAMKSNASICERSVISFGRDVQHLIWDNADRADQLYRAVAEGIAEAFGLEVLGLVVHVDEHGPHAHFQMDSFDKHGKSVSARIMQNGTRIQTLAAEIAQQSFPEIQRGESKAKRIAEGADPDDLKTKNVKELHEALGVPQPGSADDVDRAVENLLKVEEAVKEAEEACRRAEAQAADTIERMVLAAEAVTRDVARPTETVGIWRAGMAYTAALWRGRFLPISNPDTPWPAAVWRSLRSLASRVAGSVDQRVLSLTAAVTDLRRQLDALQPDALPSPEESRQRKQDSLDQRLLEAVAAGRHPEARQALENGADPEARNENGWTALHIAAAAGSRDLVQELLNSGADMNATAPGGQVEVARLLLESGSDMNAVDKDGLTPLAWAKRHGSEHLAQVLIDAGAEADGGPSP